MSLFIILRRLPSLSVCTTDRKRFQSSVMASMKAVLLRNSPVFDSNLNSESRLPLLNDLRSPSRLRAIDTAFATLLCNTCLPGPVFHYSGHSHPQLLGCHLCRTKSWFVFGNSPGEFMGRTNSQSCLGMGSRTCIPNGSFVFVGYVNRTTRTIPKRELEGME